MNASGFYPILAVFMIAAVALPHFFYKVDFVQGIAFEFLGMTTCFFVSVAFLRGTETSFLDLGTLAQVLILFVFGCMVECGYLLFKYYR